MWTFDLDFYHSNFILTKDLDQKRMKMVEETQVICLCKRCFDMRSF